MARLKRDSKGRFLSRGGKRRRRRRARRANPAGFLGLPLWVWLLGGAAAFYFLVIRKSAASALPAGPTAEIVPGAAAALTAAGQQGYGLSPYGRY